MEASKTFTFFDRLVTHGGDKSLYEDWDFCLRMETKSSPKNWLHPVNFAEGRYQVKLAVQEMKETEKEVLFGVGWINFPKDVDPTLQHRVGWPIRFTKPGQYTGEEPVAKMWHGPGYDTDPAIPWDWKSAYEDNSIFTIIRPFGQDPFPITLQVTLTINAASPNISQR
jgi:hypothetical protein